MENRMMNTVKNMAIGMAVGTAVAAAGAMYLNENKQVTRKAMNKMEKGKKIITRAGEDIIREIND